MRKYIHTRNNNRKKARLPLGKRTVIGICGLVLLGMCLGAAVFGMYRSLGQSEFFRITTVDLEGCRKTSKNEIIELSGIDIYSNLLAVKAKVIEDRIKQHQWVRTVRVQKIWPNKLVVGVQERVPVALMVLDQQLFYVDRSGKAFVQATPPYDMDYPVITGYHKGNGPTTTGHSVLENALQLVCMAGSGESVLPRQNISEVNIRDNGDIVLYLANRPFPIFIGNGHIRRKYQRLAKVLYWLYKKNEFGDISYIRMDYSADKVLVGKAS